MLLMAQCGDILLIGEGWPLGASLGLLQSMFPCYLPQTRFQSTDEVHAAHCEFIFCVSSSPLAILRRASLHEQLPSGTRSWVESSVMGF